MLSMSVGCVAELLQGELYIMKLVNNGLNMCCIRSPLDSPTVVGRHTHIVLVLYLARELSAS